jgi:L-ascorbate metabolism protein UlaG (beta-lactamase superfamily)
MIHDPLESAGAPSLKSSEWQTSDPARKRLLSLLAKPEDANHIGLRPTEGWRQRNWQFLGEVLIPSLLTPREPGREIVNIPLASHPEIGVTWLGHAGFFVQMAGSNLVIDPNWALWHGPVKRVRHPSLWPHDLPTVDLVLVTHAHFDHLHLPSLRRLAHGQPIIVPKGVGSVVKRCGFGQIVELDTWQSCEFEDLTITMTPARHWGARMIHDTHRKFGGYLIKDDERTLFHCGDSAMFDGFAEIGRRARIDVALMPIGAYEAPSGRPVHMNPEEALDAFEMMEAGLLVPMHHNTFPLGNEPLHEPQLRLEQAAMNRDLIQRVRILHEGDSALF